MSIAISTTITKAFELMEFTVNLGTRSYPIILDRNISDTLPDILKKEFHKSRFALITNTTLASMYSTLIDSWKQKLDIMVHEMPDGEQYKTLDSWKGILDFLVQSKFERSSVLLAFGGGVVGDVAGFAASAFLRGIPFIQIPTTLLAMVDSSVGGKTAVDHPDGKNLIGAFYQPQRVFVDTQFINTLPQKEFVSGYAELFKYGFIGGKEMFDFVKSNNTKMLDKDQDILLDGIKRSIDIKARVVAQDEYETKGLRALLNFGHTFAHSLERFYNFSGILHGESVFWGIKCACELGKRIGTIPLEETNAYDNQIAMMPLPKLPSIPDPETLYRMMFSDKKVESGKINFIVPTTAGASIVKGDISAGDILETLKTVFVKQR
jgi:3-dehydroquinate synthase